MADPFTLTALGLIGIGSLIFAGSAGGAIASKKSQSLQEELEKTNALLQKAREINAQSTAASQRVENNVLQVNAGGARLQETAARVIPPVQETLDRMHGDVQTRREIVDQINVAIVQAQQAANQQQQAAANLNDATQALQREQAQRIERLTRENAALRERVQQLTTTNEQLNERVERLIANSERLMQRVVQGEAVQQQTIDRLTRENQELKVDLAEMRTRLEMLEKK